MSDKPDPMAILENIPAENSTQSDSKKKKSLPPVHLWNPDFCGDIDMRIAADGAWYYQGSIIKRQSMVRLFSTILRKDDDKYYLVTPVEKVGITVDDAPFVVPLLTVEDDSSEQVLTFTTNVDDLVKADKEHPIWVDYSDPSGEPRPYIHIRSGLDALISRNVFYQLVELAQEKIIDGRQFMVVSSCGEEYVLGEL